MVECGSSGVCRWCGKATMCHRVPKVVAGRGAGRSGATGGSGRWIGGPSWSGANGGEGLKDV